MEITSEKYDELETQFVQNCFIVAVGRNPQVIFDFNAAQRRFAEFADWAGYEIHDPEELLEEEGELEEDEYRGE